MLKKLIVTKQIKLGIPGTPSIWMAGEKVIMEFYFPAELTEVLLSNPNFICMCQELGATHWEVTDLPPTPIKVEFPENFYGPITYHGGN